MKLLWFNFLLPWIWPTGFNGSIEARNLRIKATNVRQLSPESLGFLCHLLQLGLRVFFFFQEAGIGVSVFNLDNFIKMIPWLCGHWGLQMNQPTLELSSQVAPRELPLNPAQRSSQRMELRVRGDPQAAQTLVGNAFSSSSHRH